MLKKYVLAVVVVFIAIELMNMIFHGVLLSGLYKESAAIWRPDMMKYMWIMYISTICQSIGFVYIYYKLVSGKSPFRGVWYGLSFGFTVGAGMGGATYGMIAMPGALAVSWFCGSVVIFGIAGWIAALIIKE